MFMDSFKEIYAEFHRLSFSASDSGGSSVVAYFEARKQKGKRKHEGLEPRQSTLSQRTRKKDGEDDKRSLG